MTDFRDREKGEEAKFAFAEEKKFQARAMRNRKLGKWAGELMGMSLAEAGQYGETLLDIEVREQGDKGVFKRIRSDFDRHRVDKSDHQIRHMMDRLLEEALNKLGVKPD